MKKTIGFFQRAIIYYIDNEKESILETPKEMSGIMYRFAGLIFCNVDLEYNGKFTELVENWKKTNQQIVYYIGKETFLIELEKECLQCDRMELFGIFTGLLKNAESVIIDPCGTMEIWK